MVDAQIHCVVDNGSGCIKAGFSGEEAPLHIFPTIVGKTKVKGIFVGDEKKESILGSEAEEKFGILDINYPIQGGMVVDWNQMERIWAHTFYDQLKIAPEEQNILLSEAPYNTKENREKIVEMMFETFNCAGTYLSQQPVLAAYSVGKSTCLSIDCGHGSTNFAPIYEGILLKEAVTHIPVAGKEIHLLLTKLLQNNGQIIDSKMQMQSIIKAKELYCYYNNENAPDCEKIEWELPDKRKIEIKSEKFEAPEVIFKPAKFDYKCKSFRAAFLESLKKTDMDLRETMLNQIIFNGATSLIKGFKTRVTNEILEITQDFDCEKNVHVYPEAKYMTWIGGSILSSLGNFSTLWITKGEYKEEGAAIVHKKCF